MRFGMIGSGSWATALAKILADHGNELNWWIRNTESIHYFQKRRHNPHYLKTAYFDTTQLNLENEIQNVIKHSDCLVMAVPSAYIENILNELPLDIFEDKKILSAIKGILPNSNLMLNDFLSQKFDFKIEDYFTILGPCHAEEVAAEKLSYLTFSGVSSDKALEIGNYFKTDYINIVANQDVVGVQYAAVLKNIYALGAGIAHGLEYGDNFQSVFIANAAHEMFVFLSAMVDPDVTNINHTTSVYLGDLLVTCYSLYSRNRTFGNMIGKGYSVRSAQLEMNMVAEGYNASKCIYHMNQSLGAHIPIATGIYRILWEQEEPESVFKELEMKLL